jgi:hypothetical protein
MLGLSFLSNGEIMTGNMSSYDFQGSNGGFSLQPYLITGKYMGQNVQL